MRSTRHGHLVPFLLAVLLVAIGVVVPAAPAYARTDTFDFEPSQWTAGQIVDRVGPITIPQRAQVFTPARTTTASGTQALRATANCNDDVCSNKMNVMRLNFDTAVSDVSMRLGTDDPVDEFCFPERECALYARVIGYDAQGAAVADSRDVKLPYGAGFVAPLTTEVAIHDASARIRAVTVSFGTDLFGNQFSVTRRVQLDQLILITPDGPVTTQPKPAPPTVTITNPAAQTYIDEYSQVAVSGQVTAPGGILAFCVRANEPAPPPPAECRDTAQLDATNRFSKVRLPDTSLAEGSNVLSAYVWDLNGQVGAGKVTVVLPKRDIDVRIIGMDVTQGTQTDGVMANDEDGSVPYSGLPLVQSKQTVVRVYANRVGAGPTRDVTVRLWVISRQGPSYSESYLPNAGPRTLQRGDATITGSMRADPDGSYTFGFTALRAGTIELYAEILTKQSYCTNEGKCFQLTTLVECATCDGNNTMRVTGIATRPLDTLMFSPVEVVWTDKNGVTHRPPVDPRAAFFRNPLASATTAASPPGFGDATPQPAFKTIVRPYAAQVDVTDLKNQYDTDQDRDALQDGVLSRVIGVETANLPGYTIGLSEGLHVGLEKPVFFLWPPKLEPPFGARFEPVAVADLSTTKNPDGTEKSRPLTSVAHEIFHQLAYYHAGLGCESGVVSISWPPDQRGLASEGWFLDTRLGSGGNQRYKPLLRNLPSGPAELFDLMSYCSHGNDKISVVSVRNWNAFGSTLPNGVLPEPVYMGDADLVITQHRAETIRVDAHVDGQQAAPPVVTAGTGVATATAKQSPFQFVAKDSAGTTIGTYNGVVMQNADAAAAPASSSVSVEIPASDVREVSLVRNGTVLSTTRRSPHPPKVSGVAVHPNPATDPPTVTLTWNSSDADADPLLAKVEYSPDGGKTFHVIGNGVRGAELTVPARSLSRADNGRVRVSVSDGFSTTVSTSAPVHADGSPPTIRITDPYPDTHVRADLPVVLHGEGFDDTNRNLDDNDLRWTEGNRTLGQGTELRFRGTPGKHTITLTGRDGTGRTSHADVTVTLDPVDPILTYAKPVRTPTGQDRTLSLSVSGSVQATLHIGTYTAPVETDPTTINVPIPATCDTTMLSWTLTASGRSSAGTLAVDRACGGHRSLWWLFVLTVVAVLIAFAIVIWLRIRRRSAA
jgi:hypothetical protein